MMRNVYVESSNIDYIGYDDESKNLVVGFQNGRVYAYGGVSLEVAGGLAFAESPGRFLNKEIKPNYKCVETTGT